MVDAACPELVAHAIGSSETEVGDGKAETVVEAEDILRLQVAVIDIQGMAVLNRIEQLKENLPDEVVVSKVSPVVKDLCEQVAVGAIVHDDPCVVVVLDNTV